MEVSLKIRGIYTTALTKFFMDKGLTIVSPSETILKRFGQGKKFAPAGSADVEIRDLEGAQGILLTGIAEQSGHVVALIREAFLDAICRKRSDDQHDCAVEVEFPYLTKAALDDLRNNVLPTLLNHHRLRIIAPEYLDLMEKKGLFYHPERRESVSRNLEKRLSWETYEVGKALGIDHVKLDGRLLSLSEGEIVEVDSAQRALTLKRSKFKGRTKYDGLAVSKEQGDYAITRVKEGDWFYTHTYFRQSGQLIGTYYNINTLVEFYPDRIRYVDLEIDVVQWPDGNMEIIDEEALNNYFEAGFMSEVLKRTAQRTAHSLKSLGTTTKRGN